MPAPNEISVSQLNRLIGTPDCPEIIDVCIDPDFADDPYLIPGSRRHPHNNVTGLIQSLKAPRAVVVCQKGLKLSQGVAAILRSEGVKAEYLQGGMFGWREDKDTLRIPADALPQAPGTRSTWVTRHRPKIDRIACPWLIRRFVDRNARVLFVAPSEVASVAEKFDAIPFDLDGTFWSHRGPRCSFDTMLDELGLFSPALLRMAEVIRAADTGRNNEHPAAEGLLAISIGLSRQYRDDNAQLEAGMAIYDALYRWARDGYEETHTDPICR